MRWRNRATGVETEKAIRNLFLFVGAEPATTWLKGCGVALDGHGFVRTGASCGRDDEAVDGRPQRPLPLESSIPGVFAVGDARAGSIKRVGAAIGEGAAAVAQLHAVLAEAVRVG